MTACSRQDSSVSWDLHFIRAATGQCVPDGNAAGLCLWCCVEERFLLCFLSDCFLYLKIRSISMMISIQQLLILVHAAMIFDLLLCSSSGCCAVLPGMLLLATASPRHWEHGGPGLLKARVFIGFKVFTVFPMVCGYLSLQPPSRNKIKKWWEFKMLVLLSKPLCCKNMQLSFHRTRYMRCFWGQTLFKQYICSYCRLTLTDKIMETMLGIDRRSPVYIWFHNQVFPVRFQNINDANLTYVSLFAGKGSKLSSIGFACGLEGLKQMTRVFS